MNKFKSPGKFQPVHKTECKKKLKGKYSFNKVVIDTDTLCNGRPDDDIMVQIFEYNLNGNHKKVSESTFTLMDVEQAGSNHMLSGRGGYNIQICDFSSAPRVSFLDYIFGGCEIGVQVAIDFTISNGETTNPCSLHYVNPQTYQNEYTQAIRAVLDVVQDYDADQLYPVYGFGGKLPGNLEAISHCFALNGDIHKPSCNLTTGVLEAYYKSLNKVNLYGPTNFRQIIEQANGYA